MQYLTVFNSGRFPALAHRYFVSDTLSVGADPVYCLKWSPDGKYLAAASANGSIIVWKVVLSAAERAEQKIALQNSSEKNSAHVMRQEPVAKFSHESTVNSLDWSSNGFLLSSSDDHTVKLWHINRSGCLHTYMFTGVVTQARFLKSDDRFFIGCQWDGHIYLFSIIEKQIVYERQLDLQITSFDVACTNANSSDVHVIVGGDKGWVWVLDLLKSFETITTYQIVNSKNHTAHRVTSVECFMDYYTPSNINRVHQKGSKKDVKILITTNDSKVRLINYTARALEVKYSGYENKSSSIKAHINDNKNLIITGSEDGWVYVWETYHGHKFGAGHMSTNDNASHPTNCNGEKKDHHHNILGKLLKPLAHGLPFLGDDSAQVKNNKYISWHVFNSKANVAIWAPRVTSKLLELSDDPIWETYTLGSSISKNKLVPGLTEETPTGAVGSTGIAGEDIFSNSIFAAADNQGQIKIVRLDYAYKYRKMLAKKSINPNGGGGSMSGTLNGSGSSSGGNGASSVLGSLDRTKSFLRGARSRTGSNVTESTLESQFGELGINPSINSNLMNNGNLNGEGHSIFSFNENDDNEKYDGSVTGSTLQSLGATAIEHSLPQYRLGPDEQLKRKRLQQSKQQSLLGGNAHDQGNVDEELRRLMKQREHDLMEKNKPAQTNTAADSVRCVKCNGDRFEARPMHLGDTNEITFFCKDCGLKHETP